NLQQPSSISNAINRYFCNVPTELASKLPKADRHFSAYMRRKKSTFRFAQLQNKVVRVINNVPLRDHITPHYANLGLIKLPDIVKLNTCQLIYDHFVDKKPSNFTLASVSEQHNYDTRSASLQHLNPSSFKINLRKFCPTVIGCYY
ncbi:unnamed protein product, partial [Porites evermanni]